LGLGSDIRQCCSTAGGKSRVRMVGTERVREPKLYEALCVT